MMKFEHLIWFVIFLVFILSILLKRLRTVSKDGDRQIVRPGWKQKLDGFLAKAREEVKTAPGDEAADETVWDRFLSQDDDEREPLRETAPSEKAEPVEETKPIPMERPVPVKAAVRRVEPAPTGERLPSKEKESAYEISDLRKAVVWAEILAPPLALRDR